MRIVGSLTAIFTNPLTVFWLAIAAISIVPIVSSYWSKTRRAEIDAELKLRMLELGMSAEEIERVLKAQSPDK